MKRSSYTLLLVSLLIIMPKGSVFGVSLLEKNRARQEITALKERIKAEESAYQLALQGDLSETEKVTLTTQYTQIRQRLFKQIRQQRAVINDHVDSTEKWFWDTAKAVGLVALVGLAAYKFFQTPSVEIKNLLPDQQPLNKADGNAPYATNIVELVTEEDKQNLILPQQFDQPQDNVGLSLQKQRQPLTKEEIEKYKNASNAYGASAVWFSFATMIGGTFFLPYALATFAGSVYYGIKALPQFN